jgi:hypothetical protein
MAGLFEQKIIKKVAKCVAVFDGASNLNFGGW